MTGNLQKFDSGGRPLRQLLLADPTKPLIFKGFFVATCPCLLPLSARALVAKTGSTWRPKCPSLPVYRLGNVWTLHTRINGKQVKRSLRTTHKQQATIRAVQLLESLLMPIPDLTDVLKAAQRQGKKYEIDLVRGIARTDGSAEDHKRMMQALKAMPKPSAPAVTSTPPPSRAQHPDAHSTEREIFQLP